MRPQAVQKTMMIKPRPTMNLSMKTYLGVSAHAFRWKAAGKIKAIGVQKREPVIDRNLSRSSHTKRAITTVKATISVRVKFLHHWRFGDLGQPAYK